MRMGKKVPVAHLQTMRNPKIRHGMNQNSGYMRCGVYEVTKSKSKIQTQVFDPVTCPKCALWAKKVRVAHLQTMRNPKNMIWYESKQRLNEMWCLRSNQV